MKWQEIQNIELGGVDSNDYPDMADATAIYAEWVTGEPLTDDELDIFNDEFAEEIAEMARGVAI